ncbi:Nudix family hydrolase [Paenalcaligenes hominis]|uniref:Nudix family hydrolase n=1 Tax=Paenalcaligenes hominis TaxID=643674 RepID=UPI003524DF11
MATKPYVRVAVGVMVQPTGAVLLGSRPADKPWAHWWELPGGKIEPSESVHDALVRELHEEIAIQATEIRPWVRYIHHYPRSTVELHFCLVTKWEGTPSPQENQQLAWYDPFAPTPLTIGPILPATFPVLKWLTLPNRYLISHIGSPSGLQPWLAQLEQALENGVKLVQFREPEWEQHSPQSIDLLDALEQTMALCQRYQARCLLNSVHGLDWLHYTDGLHLRSQDAQRLVAQQIAAPVRADQLVAMSTHSAADMQLAQQLNTDFVVLGHVLPTPSHPDQAALGWNTFTQLATLAGRPVYAIGGQNPTTLAIAQQHGAHGIAGIRQLV